MAKKEIILEKNKLYDGEGKSRSEKKIEKENQEKIIKENENSFCRFINVLLKPYDYFKKWKNKKRGKK